MKNRLPDLNVPARERIGWVDLLRVIACFLVVFSHSLSLIHISEPTRH